MVQLPDDDRRFRESSDLHPLCISFAWTLQPAKPIPLAHPLVGVTVVGGGGEEEEEGQQEEARAPAQGCSGRIGLLRPSVPWNTCQWAGSSSFSCVGGCHFLS